MMPIIGLIVGASALLLCAIAEEIRRERAFRRRNRAWMLAQGTVERHTTPDRGNPDLSGLGAPIEVHHDAGAPGRLDQEQLLRGGFEAD